MGLTQPKVSDMMRGDFSNLSERKLMDCLTRLGYDIEITIRPAKAEVSSPPRPPIICASERPIPPNPPVQTRLAGPSGYAGAAGFSVA